MASSHGNPPTSNYNHGKKLIFSSLPRELQSEIWDIAIANQSSEERILSIAPDENPQTRTLEAAKTIHFYILRSSKNALPVRSLLHVNHYTRTHSLAHYTLWPLAEEETYKPLPSAKIYINKSSDIFFFHSFNYDHYWFLDAAVRAAYYHDSLETHLIRDEARLHLLSQLSGIKKFALPIHLLINIFQNHGPGPARLFTAFGQPSALQITIIIDPAQPQEGLVPKPRKYITGFADLELQNTLLYQCVQEFLASIEARHQQANVLPQPLQVQYNPNNIWDVRQMAADFEKDCGAGAEAAAPRITADHRAFRLLVLRRSMHAVKESVGESSLEFRAMMSLGSEPGADEAGSEDYNRHSIAELRLIETMLRWCGRWCQRDSPRWKAMIDLRRSSEQAKRSLDSYNKGFRSKYGSHNSEI